MALSQTRPLLVRITPDGEAVSAGGLGRPDAASQLLMYTSSVSVRGVYIRITEVRCLRPRSTYMVYSCRSLFTQGGISRILRTSPFGVSPKFSNHSEPGRREGSFAGPDFWALRLGVYF